MVYAVHTALTLTIWQLVGMQGEVAVMEKVPAKQVAEILSQYDPAQPGAAADELRSLWLQFDPKSIAVIKASLRDQQETIGIPVPVLKSIGREISKVAKGQVDAYLPLVQLLWDEYGREGRVVATIPMGAMELAEPEKVVPLLREICRTCLTWEDADRLAMDALEPVVRQKPDEWLPAPAAWLQDENNWVRRAAVIVFGRLPLKHPAYARECLSLIESLLYDEDEQVKKAVSFAIRLVARVDTALVHELLSQNVPPEDPAAAWVLCDVIRSMTKSYLAGYVDLMPLYLEWDAAQETTAQERRSIQSAVKTLQKANA